MSVQTQSRAIAWESLREWSRPSALLRNPWLWVAGITVVGFALRRYHLGSESLWFDEADIVAQARQPLSALIDAFAKAGENGPLYTLMLHYWLALGDQVPGVSRLMDLLFGSSLEAHVRGLSMLFGTTAIPLMFVFARRVGGVALGVLSAALLMINPFDLWYSQDAKMYSLLVLMTIATSILYIRALERNTVAAWAVYVVATWVMLTVHSLAGLVLFGQVVATPLMVRTTVPKGNPDDRRPTTVDDRRRPGRRWVRLFVAVLIILAPIFPIAWLRVAAIVTGTVDTGNWYTNASLPDILITLFVKFAVNQAAPTGLGGITIPWETIGALCMAGFALVGAWGMGNVEFGMRNRRSADTPGKTTDDGRPTMDDDRRTVDIPHSAFHIPHWAVPRPQWLVFSLWVVPVLVFWLVTLVVALFQPRYLIMALPSYLITAAAGILALRRVHFALVAVPLALLGLATGAAMLTINYSPTPQKEDWRGAMVYIQDHLRSYDTIVVFPGYLDSAVNIYYQPGGPGHVPGQPVDAVPSLDTKDYGQRELQADLRQMVTCAQRAWLVVSPVRADQEDPQHRVQQWFQYNYHTFDTEQFNGVTVYGISFNGQPNCWYPGPTTTEPHTYQNGLILLGYTYQLRDPNTADAKQPDASYFPLTIYWRTNADKLPDYDVRVMITGPSGKVVDQTLGPLNGYWPSSQWPVNDNVLDYRDLRLPGGLTPGDYTVSVQLLPKDHPDQPVRLKDGSATVVFKQPLKVVPWKP